MPQNNQHKKASTEIPRHLNKISYFMIKQNFPTILFIIITHHLFNLFFNKYWKELTDSYTELKIAISGTIMISTFGVWIPSTLFVLIDHFRYPKWIYKRKIQPNKEVDIYGHLPSLPLVIANQIIGIPVIIFFSNIMIKNNCVNAEIPSLSTTLKDIIISGAFFDIWFYLVHRSLHTPRLYKSIHYIHHTHKSPTSLSSNNNLKYQLSH